MTKCFFILIFNFLFLQNSFAAESKRTQVTLYADEGYPPYSYTEKNQLKGIYIDIMMAAQKYLPDYKLILEPVPWQRGLYELKKGDIFGMIPPYYSNERTYMELSHPLNSENVSLLCLPEVVTASPMNFPGDFKDKTIGINSGFSFSGNFIEAQTKKLINVEEAKDNEINLKKMAGHRLDCYANDRYSIFYTLKKMQSQLNADSNIKKLKLIVAYDLSKKNAYIGYSKNFKAVYRNDFIKKMNVIIDKLHTNGEIEGILKKHGL